MVERLDKKAAHRLLTNFPVDGAARKEMIGTIEEDLSILKSRSDLRSQQWVDQTADALLEQAGLNVADEAFAPLAELVHLGLVEALGSVAQIG